VDIALQNGGTRSPFKIGVQIRVALKLFEPGSHSGTDHGGVVFGSQPSATVSVHQIECVGFELFKAF
jgi:hypothetical protein